MGPIERAGKTVCAVRVAALAMLVAGGAASPREARADSAPVRLGELSVPAEAGVSGELVREAVGLELGRLDAAALGRARRPLVLSVAVRLEGSTCKVNATLRDARRGTMLAILEGSASAAAGRAPAPNVRDAIVRVAVRGAVSQIPDAIRGR